jgi:hypothetical protein
MTDALHIILRIGVAVLGILLTLRTIVSVIRTLVLARSARDRITSIVFRSVRRIFDLRAKTANTYEQRDAVLAFYAPVSLLLMPVVWLTLITLGYALVFWALGTDSPYDAFTLSGSSLLTLGFERADGVVNMVLIFSEATIGLIVIALLISYLPSMYGAFARRETAVTMLEVRAGLPPSAVGMISRQYRIRGLDYLVELWEEWEKWFADLQESHTSLAPLVFFRSIDPHLSWVTASGAILDSASMYESMLDMPSSPQAALCIRAGYLALRAIADFFNIPYNPDPAPDDPISISRVEFDEAYEQLAAGGVPLRPNRDQAWKDFVGWRVNYDRVLLALAALTMAPYAPWSSDRSLPRSFRGFIRKNG